MVPSEKQRTSSRIHQRIAAHYANEGAPVVGTILNFSEFGLFIETQKPLQPSSTVSLEIGAGTEFTLQGKVIWSFHVGMGISLIAPPEGWVEFVRKKRKDLNVVVEQSVTALPIRPAGTLEETSLPQLFRWITVSGFTGELLLIHGDVKKTVLFEKGRMISARSNIQNETLGVMLLNEGVLSADQLQTAVQLVATKEVARLGEALAVLGYVKHELLNDLLQRHTLARIKELFLWKEGEYSLLSDLPEDVARVPLEESVTKIMFRGLVEKYKKQPKDQASVAATIPSHSTCDGIEVEQLQFSGRESALYRALNGVTSISEVISKSRMEPAEATAVIYALADLGVIHLEVKQEPKPAKKKEEKKPVERPGVMPEIEQRLKDIQSQNFFEVLGLTPNANQLVIKNAYFELAKKFHPDRFPRDLAPADHKLIESYFARLSEVYSKLSTEALRKEYEATLHLRDPKTGVVGLDKASQAELDFKAGITALRKEDFEGALAAFERATELNGKEAKYFLHLGWARFRLGSRKKKMEMMKNGKEEIKKGIQMNPELADGFYYLGVIIKVEGDIDLAKKYFAKAADLNPKHSEALAELHVIQMRQAKKGWKK